MGRSAPGSSFLNLSKILPMIISRIKFYADTIHGEKNKLFCYSCNELEFQEFFSRQFAAGHTIRAAWFEKIENPGKKVLENSRFSQKNLNDFFEYYVSSNSEKRKIDITLALSAKQSFLDATRKESILLSEQIIKLLNSQA